MNRRAVAICKNCGTKYNRWITPVSAKGVCGDCFQTEVTREEQVQPQQPELLSSDLVVPAETPKGRIHLRSFIPRTRSPAVFAVVMACYCITLASFIGGWARLAGLHRPSPPFYLRGNPADVISLLIVAPLIESLLLVGVVELVR